MNEKSKYFIAFLDELYNWYGKKEQNDLSKLKVLKLFFLGVSKDEELLGIYNNFQAWTYGPVEKDIYDYISGNLLEFFIVDKNKTTKIKNIIGIEKKYLDKAKELITFLKKQNENLISYSSSYLVDITHKWQSWKLSNESGLLMMSPSLILSDKGYYGKYN